MRYWIALQLVFDIFFVLAIIVLVIREGKTRSKMPRYEDLKGLVDEFKSAVEKSEKVAQDLDAQLRLRRDTLTGARPSAPAHRPGPDMKAIAKTDGHPPKGAPSLEAIEEHKRKVAALYRQGIPKDEISRRLAIPMPEVELIVAMLAAND